MTISELETVQMDIRDIRKYLPSRCKALLYKTLSNSKKKVFADHDAVVVLYESKIGGKKQGHYICLINRGNSVEYFSSMGRGPNDELQQLQLAESPKFADILGKNYTYNKRALQNSRNYKVNTCGLWVIARCLLRDKSISDFVKLFGKQTISDPDEAIARFSLLLHEYIQDKN